MVWFAFRTSRIMVLSIGGIAAMGISIGLSGCGRHSSGAHNHTRLQAESSSGQPAPADVRQAAVAGLFYPRRKRPLASAVKSLLAETTEPRIPNLHGLIAPHAGYKYSGPVAAEAYAQLAGRDFSTVIIMAPSHYADFEGASISEADAYATPLGTTRVSPLADELAAVKPFVRRPPCHVARPGWWRQASKPAPVSGQETPHTWEHSLEVQLPFLQETLHDFTIVPIVFGRVDPRAVAEALSPHVDDKTLVVVSSDLSHHLPYEKAQKLDMSAVRAISDLDIEQMSREDACGKGPILTLMYLAVQNGWKAKLLDYRNSGDTQGDKSSVVGYAAMAFFKPSRPEEQTAGKKNAGKTNAGNSISEDKERENMAKPTTPGADTPNVYTKADRAFLLDLAKRTINDVVKNRKLPRPDSALIPERLKHERACFVTLRENGELRGCIGNIFPEEPLYKAVIRMASRAAQRDPRFPPVSAEELDKLHIEISVLSEPKPFEFNSPDELLEKLRPNIDGVVLKLGLNQATFLPQVWEQLPDKREFLARLCVKAGLAPTAWKEPGLKIETYQAEAFEEHNE